MRAAGDLVRDAGHIRVRVGGVADPPADGPFEAFVLLGLADGPPAMPSGALPHQDSALLPTDRWQTWHFETDARAATAATLRLEVVCWRPGVGERSLGRMEVGLHRVLQFGRMEIVAPLGVAVEVDWIPPAGRRSGEYADVLAGSGVRRAASSWAQNEHEASRARVWVDHGPTPSFPSSVCGLPPSRPAQAGHAWVWGANEWHEVPTA